VSDDHVTLPIRLPDLTHLTNDELHALRSKLSTGMRDGRKKATTIISRIPEVRSPWMKSMSLKTDDPTRAEIMANLEFELLRHPEAYIAYAHVNSLFLLDGAIRDEMLRRSMLPNGKSKKKAEEVQAPPPVEEDVLATIQAIEEQDAG